MHLLFTHMHMRHTDDAASGTIYGYNIFFKGTFRGRLAIIWSVGWLLLYIYYIYIFRKIIKFIFVNNEVFIFYIFNIKCEVTLVMTTALCSSGIFVLWQVRKHH